MPKSVDVVKLRNEWQSLGCMGVVALINYLEKNREAGRVIKRIGSSRIDWDGTVRRLRHRANTHDAAYHKMFSLPYFYIGAADGSITPLEWLAEVLFHLKSNPPEFTRSLDRLCEDLATNDEKNYKVIFKKVEIT